MGKEYIIKNTMTRLILSVVAVIIVSAIWVPITREIENNLNLNQ